MARIESYTRSLAVADFLASAMVQDAVIRNIEVIGEASNNIQRTDPAFAAQHGHIPWLVMYTMRNRVSHGYAQVDLQIVWQTIRRDLPALRTKIEAALAAWQSGH
ncbi:MAG: DUF86 domain-containing protein [Burkholderiaceae bacterium]